MRGRGRRGGGGERGRGRDEGEGEGRYILRTGVVYRHPSRPAPIIRE